MLVVQRVFRAKRTNLHEKYDHPIKEAQVGLFATRTSCHVFAANQLRVLLAALAYVLIERLRALALQGTALAANDTSTPATEAEEEVEEEVDE